MTEFLFTSRVPVTATGGERLLSDRILERILAELRRKNVDSRVEKMLAGDLVYMYHYFKEIARVCRTGVRIAFVMVVNGQIAIHG